MKLIELTGTNEKPILINPEQIVSVCESAWLEETTNKYYDPINRQHHSYPIAARHVCTQIVCVNEITYLVKESYSVVKCLLEEKNEN